MAVLNVTQSFDLNNLDLNRVYEGSLYGYYGELYDDANVTVAGETYNDVLELFWDYKSNSYASYFGGPSITMEYDFTLLFTDFYAISDGTVSGYLEFYYDGSQYIPYAAFTDLSTSAKDLFDAAKTEDTSDEYAIIIAALSGDDTFYLSAYDDIVDGYAGDDVIDGGTGNDYLTGGLGADEFIFNPNDGQDIITDFNANEDTLTYIGFTNAQLNNIVTSVTNSGHQLLTFFDGSTITLQTSDPTVSVYSYESVDLTDLDMNRLANYSSTTYYDNVSVSVFGNIYSDVLEVYWELGGVNYMTAFGGPLIEVEGDAITGGTVSGFIEYYWNGAEWFPFLGVDGFSVSAKELYQTVGTTDTSDEYLIFTAALSGDDVFYLSDHDEIVNGYAGDDVIDGATGKDYLMGGEGDDTITLTGNTTYEGLSAHNVGSSSDVATNIKLDLTGKVKLETVVDGGADADTVNLSSNGDAFFLHDSFSGFHSSLALTTDTHTGGASTQRILNVETINGLGGDDIIDLTSPDYSLAGQVITINGGAGNDVIWGSDATETLIGGDGNDIIFGGSGNDTLTGGAGADTFEFTRSAGSDTITDYSKSDGDKIKIYVESKEYFENTSTVVSNGTVTFGDISIDLVDNSINSTEDLIINYILI